MKTIKQFGINFGDNDFGTMYQAMLPVIALTVLYQEITDKSHIAKIVSEASYGFYRAVQNPFVYNNFEDSAAYKLHLEGYFKVGSEKVFIDDELTKFIGDTFHNGELFCVTVNDPPYFWRV
jgi:hypothetical protein